MSGHECMISQVSWFVAAIPQANAFANYDFGCNLEPI